MTTELKLPPLTYENLVSLLRPEFSDYAPLILDKIRNQDELEINTFLATQREMKAVGEVNRLREQLEMEVGRK